MQLINPLSSAPVSSSSSSLIWDTTTKTFEKDVLHKSMQTPVIVEFWAPWCGPCKQLMPLLEKAVQAAGGAVEMAKVNIDAHPELAQAFRVQSVPMVYAFFQGQPVDGFMGVRPESEISLFIKKLIDLSGAGAAPGEKVIDEETKKRMTRLFDQARQSLVDENTDAAMKSYSDILDLDAENADALAGLGWCLLQQGDIAAVQDIVSELTPAQKDDAAFKGIYKILALAEVSSDLSSVDDLVKRLTKNQKDHDARYDLAVVYFGQGQILPAIEALVELTRYDREWKDQQARKLLTDVFDALGPAHPLTLKGRRKLSAVLFS